ncbi:hypothetical protein BN1048_00422 [Jeotgalicoccus saudimassiliensis]|uniref:Uncharacterized protein n=1 Tax=Jeotgalicoccus saudimassiliensis TaxID=1461582 RepID=A0A078M3Q3_9STAP|nr:hypothetical protein [Jeotgalicoccus saudimassiliensis]CDZ99351.1 hypothetical protein BN1048_00422 [Jeotgalicoccus saudimassiliensis]
MRQKNEKLKVYEFLYNRLPFSDDETEEYEAMQRMDLLEEHFDLYLSKINKENMELFWHCEVIIGTDHELINVLLATEYCYYLFILHDYAGEHFINPFNILIDSSYEAVYDLNRTEKVYEKFKEALIDDGTFQRPIIIKHVVMNETFRLVKRPSDQFLSLKNLPYYLKAIEHSAVMRKKQPRPGLQS